MSIEITKNVDRNDDKLPINGPPKTTAAESSNKQDPTVICTQNVSIIGQVVTNQPMFDPKLVEPCTLTSLLYID